MRNALVLFTVVALVASVAIAAPVEEFIVTKDTGNDQNSGNANAGAAQAVRGAKNPWKEDTSYYDWENSQEISDWIDANGGRAMVQKVEFCIRPVTLWGRHDPDPDTVGIHVYGLQLTVDWAEGDGTSIWPAFNWTKRGPAATFNHCQSFYDDVDDTPASGDEVLGLDAIQWTDKDGIARGNVADSNLWPIRNANDLIAPVQWDSGYVCVELDPAFWEDILDNELNRGIILWDMEDCPHPDENWQVYMKEQGAGYEPLLKVTMIPEPASLALLAIGGVAALIRRKR